MRKSTLLHSLHEHCDRRPNAIYARDFLLLNLTIISSAVSLPLFTFSTTVLNAKPSLGPESIKRLRSAIGADVILLKFVRRYIQSAG
jgi:hypothetical protein